MQLARLDNQFLGVAGVAVKLADSLGGNLQIPAVDHYLGDACRILSSIQDAGGVAGRVAAAQHQRVQAMRVLFNTLPAAHDYDPADVGVGIESMLRKMGLLPHPAESFGHYVIYLGDLYSGRKDFPFSRSPIVGAVGMAEDLIGSGTYSDVYRGKYKRVEVIDGRLAQNTMDVAYKLLKPEGEQKPSTIVCAGLWSDMAYMGIDVGILPQPLSIAPQDRRQAQRPYLVLPLHGRDLADEIPRLQEMSVSERLRETILILKAAADEVGARSLVHGDLRLPNFLRTIDGKGWAVGDFGWARNKDKGRSRPVAHPCLYGENPGIQRMNHPRFFIPQDEHADALYMVMTILQIWLNRPIKYSDFTDLKYRPEHDSFRNIPEGLRHVLQKVLLNEINQDLTSIYKAVLQAYPQFLLT